MKFYICNIIEKIKIVYMWNNSCISHCFKIIFKELSQTIENKKKTNYYSDLILFYNMFQYGRYLNNIKATSILLDIKHILAVCMIVLSQYFNCFKISKWIQLLNLF